MRRFLAIALLLSPLAAAAADHSCQFQAPRHLDIDLGGVRGVQIELNSEDLILTAGGDSNHTQLTGRACASSEKLLDALQVTQRREGDQLIIEASDRGSYDFSFTGSHYTYLDLNLQLPAAMPVTLHVGSGDATVSGFARFQGTVGSGDLHVSDIHGPLISSVGSGDIDAKNIGSLQLGSVGSGDFKAHGIHGDAQVGSIGSGDVSLYQVQGSVKVDTLGSGDLTVKDVSGDLSLGAKGSGDVDHSGIGGKVNVPHDDDN